MRTDVGPKKGGTLKIFAGWMVDGQGDAIRRRVLVDVVDGRLTRVRHVAKSDGAEADLDFSDDMLLPGLIDSHVHLFMSGTADLETRAWQLAAPFEAMCGVIDTHLRQHLASGVAAVRDGGDYAAHALRFRQTQWDRGRHGLRLHVAGRAWRRADRYGRLIGRPPVGDQSLARAVAESREDVDHVKVVNSGLNSLEQFGRETAPQFSVDTLREAVRTAAAEQRKVMVHANGREPVRRSIEAGCHSIEHGFFMGMENLQRLADSDAFWVPTAITMQGYCLHAPPKSREVEVARRNLDHQLEQLRRARSLGVRIAAGTDAGTIGVHHGAALGEEMALLLDAGFTIPEVVRCASANGADLMGLGDTGRLAPGCRATLLALPGGPKAFPGNLATPLWFMIDGRVVFDHRDEKKVLP